MTQRQLTSDDTGPWPAVEGERVGRRLATSGTTELTVAVAEEVPVAMVFNGTSHAVMIATPADLEDFGLGFALSEGILGDPAELLDIEAHGSSGGLEVRMTITQRRFVALAERPQRVLNRDQLLDLARGRAAIPFDRSIDVQVSRLRRKIESDPKSPQIITTVRGGGYMFTPAVERA